MRSDDASENGALLAFDPDYYRQSYDDVRAFSADEAREHYLRFGMAEGRRCGPLAGREDIVRACEDAGSVLEIGPFANPVVRNGDVFYFDVLDTDQLTERARTLGLPTDRIPRIDYVSPACDLSVVDRRFDAVVSCHAIEHQPDLIAHLRAVDSLLNENGRYFVIVPDKRYCFDAFLPPSTIADVVEAHYRRADRHSVKSVIEHRALVTHNDPARHWAGDHGVEDPELVAVRTGQAMQEFAAADGGYVDVHAWQFTPTSLAKLTKLLVDLSLSPLRPLAVHGTLGGRNEFTAVLGR